MIFYHSCLLCLYLPVLTVLRMVVGNAVDAEKLAVIEPQAWRSEETLEIKMTCLVLNSK